MSLLVVPNTCLSMIKIPRKIQYIKSDEYINLNNNTDQLFKGKWHQVTLQFRDIIDTYSREELINDESTETFNIDLTVFLTNSDDD